MTEVGTMTSKERMECVFSGRKPDQYPCFEHFWGETVQAWAAEGLPSEIDPSDYFDFDIADAGSGWFDLTAQFDEELISEDEHYRVVRDTRGVVARHHKKESGHTPHWLETPIRTPSGWWKYKKRLVFDGNRINADAFDRAKHLREKGKYICLFNADPYEQAWPVFGQTQMFMAMLEEPEVVRDALDTWAALTVECLDYYIGHGLDFDGYFVYGDMGYKNGTLFSPEVYRDLVMPAHRMINDYLHSHEKKVILHSCGKIKSFIPMLIEVGFDALQPLEAKCDQDVRELAMTYDRDIAFFGNMDVRKLSADIGSIREEIESKLAAFDGNWNYIFHSDHSIPPTVSLDNYRFALELARDYLR